MTEEERMDEDVEQAKPKSISERIYGLEIRYGMLDKRVNAIEGKMNWLLTVAFSTLVGILIELLKSFGGTK